ncbi:hypothetical protein R1flu_025965 [Riccia fluitans]|uniref:Uncharacterized protein n=1 Tax=Riccia fluitans TaxID=41844 RepID=A0ABD1XEL5_9MARC
MYKKTNYTLHILPSPPRGSIRWPSSRPGRLSIREAIALILTPPRGKFLATARHNQSISEVYRPRRVRATQELTFLSQMIAGFDGEQFSGNLRCY